MFRVFLVMVILVALPLCLAVDVQPAHAVPGEVQIVPGGPPEPNNGPEEMDDFSTPGGPVDGDPDEVGGGYGFSAGSNELDDMSGGFLGIDVGDHTLEEFIYLMLLQFMVTP